MKFVEPIANPRAPLARRNPLAKLTAAMLITVALVISLDPVTPSVVLAVELAALPAFGIGLRSLLRRGWPLLAAAGGAAASYLFFAQRTGVLVASIGPFHLTTGVLTSMASLILRLLAIALSTVVVFASTDPTDLADSLVQNAKASPRFVIGALAAFRTLPLLANDWEMLRMARRARGIDAGLNPIARLRLFASTTFALLVIAIRRGTRLARAMDARGFDSRTPRGIARPQHFTAADTALIVSAVLLSTTAITASVLLGAFHPLFA